VRRRWLIEWRDGDVGQGKGLDDIEARSNWDRGNDGMNRRDVVKVGRDGDDGGEGDESRGDGRRR